MKMSPNDVSGVIWALGIFPPLVLLRIITLNIYIYIFCFFCQRVRVGPGPTRLAWGQLDPGPGPLKLAQP